MKKSWNEAQNNTGSQQELTTPFKSGRQWLDQMWKWLQWVHFWKDVWKIQNDLRETFMLLPKKKKKRLIQITSLGGVKDMLCCIWRWKTIVLRYNNQFKWKLKLTALIPNVSSLSRNLLVHQGSSRCWRTRKAPSSASWTSPKPIWQPLLQAPLRSCTSVIFCQHTIIPKHHHKTYTKKRKTKHFSIYRAERKEQEETIHRQLPYIRVCLNKNQRPVKRPVTRLSEDTKQKSANSLYSQITENETPIGTFPLLFCWTEDCFGPASFWYVQLFGPYCVRMYYKNK